MSYVCKRVRKTWYLYSKNWANGSVTWRAVAKDSPEFLNLGLRADMSRDEALAVLGQIRSEQRLLTAVQRETAQIARVTRDNLIKSAWLPAEIVREFETSTLISREIPTRHWNTAKKLIATQVTSPTEWCVRPELLWTWFRGKNYSLDYMQRILRAVNLYGVVWGLRTKQAFLAVPMPPRTYKRKMKPFVQTVPLLLEHLPRLKAQLSPEQYNWMFTSLWFGLRPREVDSLSVVNPAVWYVTEETKTDPAALYLLQEKVGKWKAIPIVFAEQVAALKMKRDRPLVKTLRKAVDGLTCRSGRRGFDALLRSHGYPQDLRSRWLGHRSIRMTQKHYEDDKVLEYREPTTKQRRQ